MIVRAFLRSLTLALLVLGLASCGGGSGGNLAGPFTLTVQRGGSGAGSVGGGGIDCGGSCTASVGAGTAVTLTATPSAGSTFGGWSGCDSVAGATCHVMMDADKTVLATFLPAQPVQHTLTVTRGGAGTGTVSGGAIACGASCTASVNDGTALTLTAAPDAGSSFVGWTGCDTVAGTTCHVTMTGDRTVGATFDLVPPTQRALTVVRAGAGTGTVAGGGIACGATCGAVLGDGAAVTLTATPAAGSTFAGWVGCDSTSGPTCSVTMSADRLVTATFDLAPPIQRTLTVARSGTGAGTVTGGGIDCGATCSALLTDGAVVTLTATPGAGSAFAGWTGCDTTLGATCGVTMTASRTVGATFDPIPGALRIVNATTFTVAQLAASPAGAGTWGANLLAAPIAPAGETTLTALPAGAWDFRAIASDGTTTWQASSVAITAGGLYTWTLQQTAPTTGALRVVNGSASTVAQLLASPVGAGTWGPNLLSAPIAPAAEATVAGLAIGTYDFMAVASDGVTTWQVSAVAITGGGLATWTIQQPPPTVGSLRVVNPTTFTVAQLLASPPGAGTWGPNLLSASIAPAAEATVAGLAAGTWDFQAVASDGTTTWQATSVVITGGGLYTWTLQQPPPVVGSLRLVNPTTFIVAQLVSSPPGLGAWGANLLAAPIAAAGEATVSSLPPGTWDFKAVASDGTTTWQATSVAITAGGLFTWTLQQPAPTLGRLDVVNGTASTIAELYLSPAGAGTWGANLLLAPILPGATATLLDLPSGSSDLAAIASDGIAHWRTAALAIPGGGTATWTLAPPPPDVGTLSLVNHHCIGIDQLYVRATPSPTWSLNLLAAPVAPNGGTLDLTTLPVGTYDVMAAAPDGQSWTTFGVTITAAGPFTWPLYMPAGTGCLAIVNNVGATIDFVFGPLSPQGCSGAVWGNDLLGGIQILPNVTTTLSGLPAGTHDLRALDLATATSYLYCAASIPSGGTLTWYLLPL